MRPIHLTIEGLRSFRTPARLESDAGPRRPTIDFTGRDHIAIIGDTGAGKSSILEAITYALYGQTTFTARANQELMNDTTTHLRVVLRFRVSGETWEVTRTLRRGGQGGVGQVRALLRRVGDDDATVEQVEQVRRVNDRIEELLGLDSDAFLRTVPPPRPLRAPPGGRRTARPQPDPAAGLAHRRAGGGGRGGRQRPPGDRDATGSTGAGGPGIPGEPDGKHLEQLQEAFDKARRRADAATEDERAASTAREAVLAAEKAQQTAAGVLERLRALDTEGAPADWRRSRPSNDSSPKRKRPCGTNRPTWRTHCLASRPTTAPRARRSRRP